MKELNTWTLIFLILLLLVLYWYVSIPKNLPPGPTAFPLIGYALFLKNNFYVTLNYLGKKYGNIYHVYTGSQLTIVLNDFEVIKEAFVKQGDIFSGRPKIRSNMGVFDEWFGGLILTNGEFWKQHRRFILRSFKIYGMGKSTLEPLILNEIYHFLEEIQSHKGKPFHMQALLMFTMSNNIQTWATGKRMDYSDPFMRSLVEAVIECDELADILRLVVVFPWADQLIRFIFQHRFKNGIKNQKTFTKLVSRAIIDAQKEFLLDQSDSYIQSYMTEKENRRIKNSLENIFTNKAIVNNIRDLLLAGTDTTANTMLWLITYMTVFPEIQSKTQREVDQVIGPNREPTYNDRLNTPYTEATILETHRFASIAPFGVPHRVLQSTTLRGYNIPENTVVQSNLWAVHHDPKLWGDPENFRPERFINANGECVKPEYLIPFSIGKRICFGEVLARMELYLYFVCLLQRFNFVPSNGVMPSLEPIAHIALEPKSDLICAEPREQ